MLLGELAPAASATHSTASHARPAHPRDANSGAAKTFAVAVSVVILEQDGVDDGVGTLRGFDCLLQTFLATCVDAIGEHDHSFATLLLLHEFVRSQVNGVIQGCASP